MIFAAKRYGANEVYYYKLGDEKTAKTGGYIAFIERSTPEFNKNADNLELICHGRSGENNDDIGGVVTNSAIDITNINYLSFVMDLLTPHSGDNVRICIFSDTSGTIVASETYATAFTGETKVLDVSAYSGSYYIGFRLGNSESSSGDVSTKVYEIYGSKTV